MIDKKAIFQKKTIEDVDVKGLRVLIRCDFNVPIESGEITDDRRIIASLPTIQYLLQRGAKVILMSHFGRPKGTIDPQYSLEPVAKRLSELLKIPVPLLIDSIGNEVEDICSHMKSGECVLLENVRFHKGETENDLTYVQSLAKLGNLYVNDAFGSAHRAHASTYGIAKIIPGVAGLLLKSEIEYFGKALQNPQRPLIVILGGAKVTDKVALIKHLVKQVDKLLIGGGSAFTFLKAKGYEIGKSLLDESLIDFAQDMLQHYNEKLVLPTDILVTNEFKEGSKSFIVDACQIPNDFIGVDIGPKAQELFKKEILKAGTVIWNGPMGLFEINDFSLGTLSIAKALGQCKGITIVGGGDSAAALDKFDLNDTVNHISTGGGASLALLEGKILPGLEVLQDK